MRKLDIYSQGITRVFRPKCALYTNHPNRDWLGCRLTMLVVSTPETKKKQAETSIDKLSNRTNFGCLANCIRCLPCRTFLATFPCAMARKDETGTL